MSIKIKNARLVMENDILTGYNLYVDQGIITAVTPEALPCAEELDAQGRYLSAGWIDIHSHGGGDADFMDGTVEAFCQAAELHARFGTTTIVPTAASGTCEETLRMIEVFKQAKRYNRLGADMPGLHLEGPYFSMEFRGAQDPRYVRSPDPEEYRRILDAAEGHILRWSVAPELSGALEMGRELNKRGILAAIGHSGADYEQVLAAVDAGYSHVTHLYSCMSSVHRRNAYRYAGIVESAYLLDALSVEIIADGVHLPQPLLEFVCRFKGPDKTALVTDSMRGAGVPEGLSILGSKANGQQVLLEDGVAKLMDRSAFAGSVATMDRLVRNAMQLGGASLTDAVKMATLTPARIMRFEDRGRLVPDCRADLVLFDDDIRVTQTFIHGKIVYRAEAETCFG